MSWGGSESSSETSTQNENHFIHAGVVFVASSGDQGAPPEWPAVSPNVVAVGGTTLKLNPDNTWKSESGWGGSGGGLGAYEPLPSYQNGVVTQSSTKRANPDVAYNADPSTGFAVYDSTVYKPYYPSSYRAQSGWFQLGGTSAGAPQWAALMAIADQGRSLAKGSPINASDPQEAQKILYANPAAFHDITGGTSTGNPNYAAGPGYDLVTGQGTPLADQTINALVAGASATATPPAAPTGLTATASSAGPITLTWTPAPGATSYNIYRKLATDPSFSTTPLLQVGGYLTSVQNINVQPGVAYDYAVQAVNNVGSSGLTGTANSATASTPTLLYQGFAAGSFPGTTWNTSTAGKGATWIQNGDATVSQTSTATGDPKKAFLNNFTSPSAPFIVEGLVHIDTWISGETARSGIAAFTNPATGQGYNLVLTGRFSNTGITVGGSTTGTIVSPHVEFLDDGVTWGADLALGSLTFQAGLNAPWYGFELMISNGSLYGAVWQASVATVSAADQPATWMGSQTGWTDRTGGAPGLNGGSGANFNGVTSGSTDSFQSFSVLS
jgi:hypothetical protein